MARKRHLAEAIADLPGLDRAAEEKPPPGHLGHRERLRQRLFQAGPQALAEYELLEMLLFHANARQDTKPIARALLDRFGSLGRVLAARPEELTEVKGVGEAAVAILKMADAVAIHLLRERARELPVLNNWDRLVAYLTAAMAREPIEQFRVLFLDARNRLIADEAQSRGTVNHTPVYPREVVKRALELGATALILVHNHPSGDPTPSRADIEMTQEVRQAAAALGIVLHDHLIIGLGRQTSFRREGLL